MKYFDLHCDTIFAISQDGSDLFERKGHIDLKRAQSSYEAYAQVFALYCGPEPLNTPQEAHRMFAKLMNTAGDQLSRCSDSVVRCRTAADLHKAEQSGKTAAFLSVEGAELLQNEEDLNRAVEEGVRIVTLAWNHDSVYACGALKDQSKGLTQKGRELVCRFDKMGIVPDVSHLSEKGFWDLAGTFAGPIVATHSNSRRICEHPRNLTDEQFREILARGGLVGLNAYVPFVTKQKTAKPKDLFPHIDHWMELGGESALAVGADFDGCELLPEGIDDITGIAHLEQDMRRHGYSEEILSGLFYGNAVRFAEKNFI